jgi:hypothetical protein
VAYATVADYMGRVGGGPLDADEAAKIAALLDDASALIDSKMPAGYTPPPGLARSTAVTMVIRRSNNPGGFRGRTIGNYSETLSESGGLYLTEDERQTLLSRYEQGGAYTVPLDSWDY